MSDDRKHIPTRLDICPVPGDSDAEAAVNNFFGKTRERVYEQDLIAEGRGSYYAQDIMWMGIRALVYYFEPFARYLHSRRAEGAFELVLLLIGGIDFRLDELSEQAPEFRQEVAECLEYILANLSKFDLNDETEYIARAQNCVTVLKGIDDRVRGTRR